MTTAILILVSVMMLMVLVGLVGIGWLIWRSKIAMDTRMAIIEEVRGLFTGINSRIDLSQSILSNQNTNICKVDENAKELNKQLTYLTERLRLMAEINKANHETLYELIQVQTPVGDDPVTPMDDETAGFLADQQIARSSASFRGKIG